MGLIDDVLNDLDEGFVGLFAQWNFWTTLLATAIIGIITYQFATHKEPDIHPFILYRQSERSAVRLPGESPEYRSPSAPFGQLTSGLNVKDPGTPRWAKGRDGDLRDIWRQVLAGVQPEDASGSVQGPTGRILTVLGTEKVIEHKLDDITRQINLIGQHIATNKGDRVAIYLPNSVELLATLFACAFYDLAAVILPFDQSEDVVISMLRRAEVDTVVTAPGVFPFESVVKSYPALRQLIWVVDPGSEHLNWNDIPQGESKVSVFTWQDIVKESPQDAGKTLPPLEGQKPPRDITLFWLSQRPFRDEMVTFTHGNFVSGVAAQLSAIPASQRIDTSDLFLPADSLANSYTLVWTLTALYSNASVAFNSAAAQAHDLSAALTGVNPTIVVATPLALARWHKQQFKNLGYFARRYKVQRMRRWASIGHMADLKGTGKLRLILTAKRAGVTPGPKDPVLSTGLLTDLRMWLGARVMYALTAAKVAGAVTQTLYYDYRLFASSRTNSETHFGPPVTSVVIVLRDTPEYKNSDDVYQGEIIVRGPAVAGGEAALGEVGIMREDWTLGSPHGEILHDDDVEN